MSKKQIQFRSECPISTALDIFGDKWSLLIIRDLMFNEKKTYGDFLTSEEGIATNILADRLTMLETSGVISKHDHPDSKAKVLYKLTPKGIDLIQVLVEVIIWSEKYYDVHPYAKQFIKQIRKDREGVVEAIRQGLRVN